jgi:hypothetical protein
VHLATDGGGRMAVVLLSPEPDPVTRRFQLAITFVDMPGSGGGGAPRQAGLSGPGNMSATESVAVAGGDAAAVQAELARRGLAPLPGPPTAAQLRAAVPAALWGGEQVSCWPDPWPGTVCRSETRWLQQPV